MNLIVVSTKSVIFKDGNEQEGQVLNVDEVLEHLHSGVSYCLSLLAVLNQ